MDNEIIGQARGAVAVGGMFSFIHPVSTDREDDSEKLREWIGQYGIGPHKVTSFSNAGFVTFKDQNGADVEIHYSWLVAD